jgi:predicted NBD/HSP70 family sugar kinase
MSGGMISTDLLCDVQAGTNADRTRARNSQAVLGCIKTAGRMGRAEIARTLGLSTQAVSNITADLLADSLLVDCGTRSAGRGLPAVQYAINPKGCYVLGVEIRPDYLLAALVDFNAQPCAIRRRALKRHTPEVVARKVVSLRDSMLKECCVTADRLLGAGIVMPGPFGQTGLSGQGSDLPGWQSVDATELFGTVFERPFAVSNDANAAAMAERFGVAKGLRDYAFLYFGAGLGLGLVRQGQLISGAFGNAGEIGHVPVMSGGELRPLEQVISRVSVQQALQEHGLLDINTLDRLYHANDSGLMSWLDSACDALGQAVGVIENLLDPQTILLGGAMPDSILNHLATHTPLPDLSVCNRPDSLIPRLQCGSSGRMTATFGAAALILNRAFAPSTLAA